MARSLAAPWGAVAAPAPLPLRTRGKQWDLLLKSAALLILITVARLHSFFPPFAAIRPALLTTFVALWALVEGYRGSRQLRHLDCALGRVMAFFVLWSLAGAPFAIYAGRSVNFLLDQFLREMVVILTISAAVRDLTDLRRLLGVYAFGVVAYAFLAAGTGSRAVGGGGYDANDSAMFIVSGIPLIFFYLVRAKKPIAKAVFGLGILFSGSAIVLSSSRGGFLALVAVMGYSLFFLKGIKSSLRGVIVGVAALVVFVQADQGFWDRMRTITDEDDYNYQSYTGRKQIWKRGMSYMWTNPILGVGIDNFVVAEGRHPEAVAMQARGKGVKWSSAHSIWVQVAAEMGIPGITALFAMFFLSVRVLLRADKLGSGRSPWGPDPYLKELGELSRPLIGVLVGAMVAGTFLSRAYSSLLWLPFALALSVYKVGKLRERELAAVVPRSRA